jgi:hypothetical protein
VRIAFTLIVISLQTNRVAYAMNLQIDQTGGTQMEMLNLEKWNTQASESVRHVLSKADAPCVGHCLVFMEPIDNDTIVWKFKTHLAFDPNNPPTQEERAKLERIFEGYAMMAQKVMDYRGEPT